MLSFSWKNKCASSKTDRGSTKGKKRKREVKAFVESELILRLGQSAAAIVPEGK